MAAGYGEYITVAGDMWDWIAYKLYGAERAAAKLIELNPQYSGYGVLPGGLKLRTPPEDETTAAVGVATLPPWKKVRGGG